MIRAAVLAISVLASSASTDVGASPVLNAKTDYGATGDGVTNDGPALAAALAACDKTHPLYLPPGIYSTRTPNLTVPVSCRFWGENTFTYYTGPGGLQPGAVIVADNSTAAFAVADAVLMLASHTSQVDGIAAFGVPAVADSFKLNGGTLNDVLAANGRNGINCAAGVARVDKSVVSQVSSIGIVGLCADAVYTNNFVHSSGSHGFYGSSSIKSILVGNTFEWNIGHGVYLDATFSPVSNITFVGNTLDRNTLANLALNGVTNVSVVGNNFRRGASGAANGAQIKYLGAIANLQQHGNTFIAQAINDDGSGAVRPDYVYDVSPAASFTTSTINDNPPSQAVGICTPGSRGMMCHASPSLRDCGNSPALAGSDFAGTVTMGTGYPGRCTIVFAAPYSAAPVCVVTWRENLPRMDYDTSASALMLVQTSSNGNKIDYICASRGSVG
jgi:hypothetical protein